MGSETRKGPGLDNKLQISVPGPTAYEIPSKVSNAMFDDDFADF